MAMRGKAKGWKSQTAHDKYLAVLSSINYRNIYQDAWQRLQQQHLQEGAGYAVNIREKQDEVIWQRDQVKSALVLLEKAANADLKSASKSDLFALQESCNTIDAILKGIDEEYVNGLYDELEAEFATLNGMANRNFRESILNTFSADMQAAFRNLPRLPSYLLKKGNNMRTRHSTRTRRASVSTTLSSAIKKKGAKVKTVPKAATDDEIKKSKYTNSGMKLHAMHMKHRKKIRDKYFQ